MRFKVYCFFITLICCTTINSQQTSRNNAIGLNYQLQDYVSIVENFGANSGKFKGSNLLFGNWNNSSKIQIDGKLYKVDNVNFNIQNNEFLYKTDTDSIFSVSSQNIDLITINSNIFKYQLYKGGQKFFKVLFESKERLSLYKGYHIRILPKSELGMLNRPMDELIKEEKFYIFNGAELDVFKLKKKDFLKFVEKDKEQALLKYVKEKKLSFKKEKDMLEILNYYDKI